LRNILLYTVFLFSLPLHGQRNFKYDTIKIEEVVISSKKINSFTPGFKSFIIDSAALSDYTHGNLADLLSEYSGIFIKSYGMGGSATTAFRGTGANHTQITWNDINLNHPMLGQSDLSLITTGLIDDIRIYYGGASMILNSGGIGGIINLETKPVWKKETVISIMPGLGSYGRYSGIVKVRSGNANFQTVTKALLQSSENDFRYLNTEISSDPVWETRQHSQVNQRGFIQELYYRKAKYMTSARIWYQSSDRNLPSSILSQQVISGEKQFDESFRTILNYDFSEGKTDLFFTGAFLLSRLNYSNTLASINSLNLSETLIFKTGTENLIGENIKLRVVFDEELSFIRSNNYDQNEARGTSTLTASAERNMGDRFGAAILLREIYSKNNFLIPDFSAGFQFRLVDQKEYFLKANFSRNSKIPTMNDLFWEPGGNPKLKNEYAFISELSFEMQKKISSPVTLKYDLSLFRNSIKDMIQWLPGEYSYWTADNIQNVNSTGLESSLSVQYSGNRVTSGFMAGYSYTRATAAGTNIRNNTLSGKQLMYIPENQANASLRFSYRNYYSCWIANMTGRRYITVENSKYLPGYFLNDLTTGVKLNLKGNMLDLNVKIDNLFNVTYQTIAYYPQPGRLYSVKLLIQITK
jgi:vitamin B12 transporter